MDEGWSLLILVIRETRAGERRKAFLSSWLVIGIVRW
jgi:hypothetical protein